jgi:hypothetical protein
VAFSIRAAHWNTRCRHYLLRRSFSGQASRPYKT